MKKTNKAIANFVRKAAVVACGQASQWGLYQTKEPKKIKK